MGPDDLGPGPYHRPLPEGETQNSDGALVPLAPLRQVVAARVYDGANVAYAVDAQAFVVDVAAAPGILGFVPWALAPPGRAVAGIELDLEAGYGAAADVPEPLRPYIGIERIAKE